MPKRWIDPNSLWRWEGDPPLAVCNEHNPPGTKIDEFRQARDCRGCEFAKAAFLVLARQLLNDETKPEFCCEQRRRALCGTYKGAQGVRVCEGCGRAQRA